MNNRANRSTGFLFTSWNVVEGEATAQFRYECELHGEFEEIVRWPVEADALHDYLKGPGKSVGDLLWLALGVSYYKVGAASLVQLPTLDENARSMVEALFTEGLAEFFVRAELPYPADIQFVGETRASVTERTASIAAGKALVAFGGGKDSYVARAILQAAGEDVELVSATLSDAVQEVLSATAPSPITFITRQLDPRLGEATKNGFNGHVPITAINMLVSTIHAAIAGHAQIVFANERSADEPTMNLSGVIANHQYSKSGDFERKVQKALSSADPDAPLPYSILRPYSELWIGRAFASLEEAHPRFTSCNRNFRLAGDAARRWCGACAKCAFTSLILAPFISREQAMTAFGQPFLDSETLLPLYRELCGLTDQKPWDCVGTIDECRAALWKASKTTDWGSSRAVVTLLPHILTTETEASLKQSWDNGLMPSPDTIVPPIYLKAARDLAS